MEALRIPGVLPRLVLEPALGATLVLDETVTVPISVLVDPFECQHRRRFEISYERGVVRPPPHLRKQDEVERRRVDRPVVPLEPGAGGLAVTHLVDDLSGLGVDRRIVLLGLQVGQDAERRAGELGAEDERLQARDDRVAAEDGHEPWHACPGELSDPAAVGLHPQ